MRNRRFVAAALILGAALAAPGVASADPKAAAADLPVASESTNLGAYEVEAQDPIGVAGFKFKVNPKVTWTGKFQPVAGWESANVRQGAYLKVSRATPIATGQLKVTWNISGGVELINKYNISQIVDLTHSKTASCLPMTYGDVAYTCTATSDALTVFRTPGVGFSPYAKVVLKAKFSITPEGAIVDRRWWVPDSNDTHGDATGLPLGLLATPEVVKVPCSAGAGLPLYYKLHNLTYTPDVVVTQQVMGQVGFTDPTGFIELPHVYEGPLTTNKTTTVPALKLKSTGSASYNLGTILPNTTKPLVEEDMVFYGKAGLPIQFDVSTWSECAIESYEWEFSTGGKAFGPTPSRTFTTLGWHTGKVTVTDETGLSTTKSFSFKVSP
jgi:hypothetical protein